MWCHLACRQHCRRVQLKVALQAGISYVVFSGGSHVPQEVLDELPTLPDGWTIPNVETKGVILVSTRRHVCWLHDMRKHALAAR